MSVTLDQVVPWGRSLEEYRQMFMLSDEELTSRILGVGDGPASFNSEMKALDHTVVSIDPIYAFSKEQIEQRIEKTYDAVISQVTLDIALLWSADARRNRVLLTFHSAGVKTRPRRNTFHG